MKIEQLSLPLDSEVPASSIKCGELFLHFNSLCMRTKPVSWILNSTLIQDKLARGFIFFVNIETGKFGCMLGSESVESVTGKLTWSR